MSAGIHDAETNSNIVTSWLPVPTAFPYFESCPEFIYTQTGNTAGNLAVAWDPLIGKSIQTDLKCLPDAVTSWWWQSNGDTPLTVTSLGPLVCPEAYFTAATSTTTSGSTFVACCPSGYNFLAAAGPLTLTQCASPLSYGQLFTYYTYSNDGGVWNYVPTVTTMEVSTSSVFAVPVNGYNFAAIIPTTTPSPLSSPFSSPPSPQSVPVEVAPAAGLTSPAAPWTPPSSPNSIAQAAPASQSNSPSASISGDSKFSAGTLNPASTLASISASASRLRSNSLSQQTDLSKFVTTSSIATQRSASSSSLPIIVIKASNLSAGAKAGIAIGAIAGFGGLIALLVAIQMIRRHRAARNLKDTQRSLVQPRHEIDGVTMPAKPELHELGIESRLAEMMG